MADTELDVSGIDWTFYETRLNINGSTQRDRNINNTKNAIKNKVINSPSCETVTVNGASKSLIIIDTSKDNVKDISSIPDETFSAGDVVVRGSLTWLVTESGTNSIDQCIGKMTQCNYTLKFQDETTGEILSYPAIFSTIGLTNTGNIDYSKLLPTLEGKISLRITFDEYTSKLREGRRLIIDNRSNIELPNTYVISNMDVVEYYGGIIFMTLERDEYRPDNDRKDLGVCDYFTLPVIHTGEARITYTGTLGITVGYSKTFIGRFYEIDEDGIETELTNIVPVWSLNHSSGSTSKFTTIIDNQNKTIKITAADDDLLINTTLILTLTEYVDPEDPEPPDTPLTNSITIPIKALY
jgi:hypothetical protein